MMMAIEMIMIYTNYLITANSIYSELNDFYDDFSIEAQMVQKAKCILNCGDDLVDYYIDEGLVQVTSLNDEYYLECNGINLTLVVRDRMIVDLKVR